MQPADLGTGGRTAHAVDPLRVDGPAKVTGAAQFTADLHVDGLWEGATVRSTEPRARLLGLEFDPSFDWSSVVVVTAADIPGANIVAMMVDDQPALAADEIRHVAEPVALVAAPTRNLAQRAAAAVRLRTEPLPAVLDPLASDNACRVIEIVAGDVDTAMAGADLVLEDSYRTGPQEHLYLEPQAMLAVPMPGGVRVHGSMQCPFTVHRAVARAMGPGAGRVEIIQEETGGGFGGKEDYPSIIAIHAALLARATGRPVRIAYDRHEDLLATTKRHPSVTRHRTGVRRDGTLVAQDIEFVLDAGAYATLSPAVLARGAIHAAGPYRCPNVRIRARAMLTNTPPNGAFRGFGSPQSGFAVETHLNRLADALQVSPVEIRRRNAYRRGDVTPTGQRLDAGVGAIDVLEAAVDRAAFDGRTDLPAAGRDPDVAVLRGRGIALGWHGVGYTGLGEGQLRSRAIVDLTPDARIAVVCANTEIGQGARTVLGQIAAEALGVPFEAVEVRRPNTLEVPDSGPTVASRTTMIAGSMIARAAAHLRADVEARTGRPFADSYRDYAAVHGAASASAIYELPANTAWDEAACHGDAYPAYGWSCAVAEVAVDTDTGAVQVERVVQAVEAGRIVNRLLAEGQVEGGTLQAVGFATSEHLDAVHGRCRQDRLATYLIPTAADAPEIVPILVERPDPRVPHGAKGLGELPMDIPAPAIVAAVHDATGTWLTQLPATPERVLAAVDAHRGST